MNLINRIVSSLVVFLIMMTVMLAGCGSPGNSEIQREELMVSAAASLKDVMEEIKCIYESQNPQIKLVYNFGSSGTLQQQIEQGAPVDLFFSAGKKQMDALEDKKLIKAESRTDIIGNEIVLVVGKNNTFIAKFEDLIKPEVKYIGIGNAESVPAGKYAKEALVSMKLYDMLKPKYVEAKDVRQVLSYVETGNADAGFVYKSDALISDKVKIAAAAPADSHEPIVYPAAVTASTGKKAEAVNFLKFLQSDKALKVYIKHGFKVLD